MSFAATIIGNHSVNPVSELKLAELPTIESVAFMKEEIAFVLSDSRVKYIPLKWSKNY